jgi:glutamate formiminotransferase/formiminotetrahydrofolate cyclodeaminase
MGEMAAVPISDYLEAAAARSPAPGGGSVSALTGALGAAMVSMVANFTVGREKYEDVQAEAGNILSESEKLRLRLTELVDEDIEAYSAVSSAYSFPKETDNEKKIRTERIAAVTREAVGVPLEAAGCCFRVLELCRRLVDIGNRNLISDVGVAVLLAEAALRGANVNVEVNLVSLRDASFVEEKRSVMKPYLEQSGEILKEVVTKVTNAIH